MKRILTGTALALLIGTGPALAQFEDPLRATVEQELQTYAPDVEVDDLTQAQLSALYLELSSSASAADMQRAIDAIVADSQYRMDEQEMTLRIGDAMGDTESADNIRAVVADRLDANGYTDVDVTNLSEDQVAQLYVVLTSGADDDTNKIESIIY
jgi:hypothetical protein